MNANVENQLFIDRPTRAGETLLTRLRSLWRAEFLSPKDLVRRAVLLAALYGIVSAFGLREFTSVLNGTMGSLSLGWQMSAFLGVIYIVSYLAFVLGTPILLIAAAILFLWKRIVK